MASAALVRISEKVPFVDYCTMSTSSWVLITFITTLYNHDFAKQTASFLSEWPLRISFPINKEHGFTQLLTSTVELGITSVPFIARRRVMEENVLLY